MRYGSVKWVLAIGVFDTSLEQTVVVPALPAVAERYSASPGTAIWIVTAYLLAAAVATPMAGRLGDQYGRRNLLQWSLAAFAVGSLACALADSIGVLIAGRAVQGLGAGAGPLAIALLRDHLPTAEVPRAVGLVVGAGGVGAVAGLLGGALLVDHVSLASVFWVLFGLAVLLWGAVRLMVPESETRSGVAVDWMGGGLLAASLVAVTLGIAQGNDWGWDSARVLALMAGFAVLLAAFAVRERMAAAPLLDPRLLAQRPIWSALCAGFAVAITFALTFALLPFYAALPESTGYGLGLTTTEIGLVLAPSAVGTLVGGPVGGHLIGIVGARVVVGSGVLCIAVTCAVFVAASESVALVAAGMVPFGFGVGLAIGAILDLIVLHADETDTGAALGVNSVVRSVGTAVGSQAAVAIVLAADELAPGLPSEDGFTAAFAMMLAAALLALLVVATVPRQLPRAGAG